MKLWNTSFNWKSGAASFWLSDKNSSIALVKVHNWLIVFNDIILLLHTDIAKVLTCPTLKARDFSTPQLEIYTIGMNAIFECNKDAIRLKEYKFNDSVRCSNKDGEAAWIGEEDLVDCIPNYCPMPALSGSNANLTKITYPTSFHDWNRNFTQGIEKQNQAYPHQTVFTFKCHRGFSYGITDFFNITCNFYAVNGSLGEWAGINSSCRGIYLETSQ